MKTIFLKSKVLIFFSILLFLQSCYIYREVPIDTVIVSNKTYKIKQESEQRKVKIIAVKDSSLVVEDWEGQREVQKKDIEKIKIKKFNVLLTVGVSVLGLLTAFATLIAIALSGISYN